MPRHEILWQGCLGILLGIVLCGHPDRVGAADRRPDPAVLTLMTLNGEFLWDGVAPEEGDATFPWKGSPTEAQEHMQEIAALIQAADPDIVNVVEVENLEALHAFNTQFLAGRGYHPYLVPGTDTYTGQDVGVLTRVDPEHDTITRDNRLGQSGTRQKGVSKHYLAKFTIGPTKMALIGVHLLAHPLQAGRRLDRQAQADLIHTLTREVRAQGYLPIVLGDFNDYDGALDSRDHIDSLPITTVLAQVKQMDPSGPADDLVNVVSLVPKTERYTAFHDADDDDTVDPPHEFTGIDHILLAPELFARVEQVEIPHAHDPRHVTDHFPLVVRLRLAAPGPPPAGRIRIIALLPNPAGDESQHEAVTLKNTGTQAVSLTGWTLQDRVRTTWALDTLGTLAPGEAKEIRRHGQPMALNNTGDTVEVRDAAAQVVHTVTYPAVEEGEVVTPAP